MKKVYIYLVVLFIALWVVSCTRLPEYQETQQKKTQMLLDESERQVGFPNIIRFQIKKELKMILEKQDRADLITYAYVYNPFMGKFIFLGLSIGYGIPYSAQYTNPEQIIYTHEGPIAIPMPDPNGIYPPTSSSATWLLLVDPVTLKINLVYIEPPITVTEMPLPKTVVSNYSPDFWKNYYAGKYHMNPEQVEQALEKFTKE